jgi:4-amino-4-deoxy-L-arabinose transferase-like glycosyltransferase
MENTKSEEKKRAKTYFFQQGREYQQFILLFAILLGLFIRMYKIGGLDVGGAWDEGYSMIAASNSIEHKTLLFINHMPDKDGILIDKPPGLYVFGATFIKLFGNHEISARAVSILFGVVSIYSFFVLINYITKERVLAILS